MLRETAKGQDLEVVFLGLVKAILSETYTNLETYDLQYVLTGLASTVAQLLIDSSGITKDHDTEAERLLKSLDI